MSQPYVLKRLSETGPTKCPCGDSFRIITGQDNDLLSLHVVRIYGQARKHVHQHHTEVYYCLEGSGHIELGDERLAFGPGTAVMIPPGTPHALRGDFRIVNIVVPPFDSEDETLVE